MSVDVAPFRSDNGAMKRQHWMMLILLPLVAILAGCPVFQTKPPGDIQKNYFMVAQGSPEEPDKRVKYYAYAPTWYTDEEPWPLVMTLHGTYGWDGPLRQTEEWGMLAEQKGFIVAAPCLYSVQGILPKHKGLWFSDLAKDERTILALIDELANTYNIDRSCILLTGFSAGGYPLWYTGLRNPDKFQMLVARACNSDIDLFESIDLTDEARAMPIFLFWGKDDLQPLQSQCWQAYRYLRERGFDETERDEVKGGHLRRPELAFDEWVVYWPAKYVQRQPPAE